MYKPYAFSVSQKEPPNLISEPKVKSEILNNFCHLHTIGNQCETVHHFTTFKKYLYTSQFNYSFSILRALLKENYHLPQKYQAIAHFNKKSILNLVFFMSFKEIWEKITFLTTWNFMSLMITNTF